MNHTREIVIPKGIDNKTALLLKKMRSDTHDALNQSSGEKIVGGTLLQSLTYTESSSSFPYYCLNKPNETVLASKYPALATKWRDEVLAFEPWGAAKSKFSFTAWAIVSNVLTFTFNKNANLSGTVSAGTSAVPSKNLTFSVSQSLTVGDVLAIGQGSTIHIESGAGTAWVSDIAIYAAAATARVLTYEELLIRAIHEAYLVHGSFTDWFCLTLLSDIGSITKGDYAITGYSVANNTISVASPLANSSASGTFADVVSIYPRRIPNSTDARHYSIAGHALVNAGDKDRAIVAGLMRLDYSQNITGAFSVGRNSRIQSGAFYITATGQTSNRDSGLEGCHYAFDASRVTRAGKTTHPADISVYTFVYAGRVVTESVTTVEDVADEAIADAALLFRKQKTLSTKYGFWGDIIWATTNTVRIMPKNFSGHSWIGCILNNGEYLESTVAITVTLNTSTLDGIGAIQASSWYNIYGYKKADSTLGFGLWYVPVGTLSVANPTRTLTINTKNGKDIKSLFPIGSNLCLYESSSKAETPIFSTTGGFNPTKDAMRVESFPATNQIYLSGNLSTTNFVATITVVYAINGHKPIDCNTGVVHTDIGSRGWVDTGIAVYSNASSLLDKFQITNGYFHFGTSVNTLNIVTTAAGALTLFRNAYIPPCKKRAKSHFSIAITSTIYIGLYWDVLNNIPIDADSLLQGHGRQREITCIHGLLSCRTDSGATGYVAAGGYEI